MAAADDRVPALVGGGSVLAVSARAHLQEQGS